MELHVHKSIVHHDAVHVDAIHVPEITMRLDDFVKLVDRVHDTIRVAVGAKLRNLVRACLFRGHLNLVVVGDVGELLLVVKIIQRIAPTLRLWKPKVPVVLGGDLLPDPDGVEFGVDHVVGEDLRVLFADPRAF